jgi:hypothetical protein
MAKPGSPLETWTSTVTGVPTASCSVADATEASTAVERSARWDPCYRRHSIGRRGSAAVMGDNDAGLLHEDDREDSLGSGEAFERDLPAFVELGVGDGFFDLGGGEHLSSAG